MPSIVDMVEIMQRLESKALHVEPRRCVMVRNRNATCRRCAEACPSGAIELHGNTISIDSERCFECGACSTVCPTEAIVSLRPVDADLFARVHAQQELCPGLGVVICARLAAKKRAAADKVVEVPCVGRVDTSLLARFAAEGATDIKIVDGHCKTCRYREACKTADSVVSSANDLFRSWGVPASVERTEELPEAVIAASEQEARGGVSRRSFFTDLKSSAKTFAVEAAQATIDVELKHKKAETLQDILKLDSKGNIPQSIPARHMRVIDDLLSVCNPEEHAVIGGPLFSRPVIDTSACNNCGLCATFCPTGALQKGERGEKNDVERWIESTAYRCVGCGMCVDVCLKKAITVEAALECDRIFDEKPEVFQGVASASKISFGRNARK